MIRSQRMKFTAEAKQLEGTRHTVCWCHPAMLLGFVCRTFCPCVTDAESIVASRRHKSLEVDSELAKAEAYEVEVDGEELEKDSGL